ncbi:IclR family transcriptional regulator [Pigmentiphaga soli]
MRAGSRADTRFPGASPSNRSLERGLRILRVFRPGASLRGNNEIAERAGLPRSTVSRLTQTLVACGFLEHDRTADAYRLGPAVLSLAEAFIAGSDVLLVAVPLMRRVSEELQVNVGLAMADGDEMVYLHAFRRNCVGMPRHVTTGHRTPVELTSLGRAHLATLGEPDLDRFLEGLRPRYADRWERLEQDIRESVRQVHEMGYCQVNWLPGVTSIATSIRLRSGVVYFINISVSTKLFGQQQVAGQLVPELLGMADAIRQGLDSADSRAAV